MTRISVYGGLGEVGGNKILVEDKDSKILLDFGASFTLRSKFFSSKFMSPRTEKSLIELGLLPNIKGLYKFDTSSKDVDAVFLSHAHMDHAMYVTFIKDEIPIYCGETCSLILSSYNKVSKSLEFNIDTKRIITFRTGVNIRVGSIEVEPVHVDHSTPGSYAFIIYTSSGAIVYTGDFRWHGLRPDLTSDFINRASKISPEIMITETTNMIGAYPSSESEVRKKLKGVIEQSKSLVLVNFQRTDVDRFKSLYEIAKLTDRRLLISPKQAYFIYMLSKDKKLGLPDISRDEHLGVIKKPKKTLYKWEKEILNKASSVDADWIAKNQRATILALSFYDVEELSTIKPEAGSCYILSSSEPINEEMELDLDRLINWLDLYGIPEYHIHVSGHILPLQLRQVIESIRPRTVIPVHGEHPELFKKLIRDLTKVEQLSKTTAYVF